MFGRTLASEARARVSERLRTAFINWDAISVTLSKNQIAVLLLVASGIPKQYVDELVERAVIDALLVRDGPTVISAKFSTYFDSNRIGGAEILRLAPIVDRAVIDLYAIYVGATAGPASYIDRDPEQDNRTYTAFTSEGVRIPLGEINAVTIDQAFAWLIGADASESPNAEREVARLGAALEGMIGSS